ncbi:AsmA-like C-terminal region-containing protein [Fulvimarina sp. MAC3]|uniref:AsmA family protein n=1 Tax=Fulvimarina sp. MAC3 TaxID=3148887 RepID=UPI0031FE1067
MRQERSVTLVRAFVLFGGLLVAALFVALIAPLFIDWSVYRSDFEREASRILGREVRVEGEATARLLPFPSVTFQDVSVAGARADEPFLTIDEFRMNAELAPYLSGEIRIFAMALENPVLRIGEEGLSLPRPSIPTRAQIVLEDIDVSNGTILFAEHSNLIDAGVSRLTAINGQFSAGSLSGPFEGAGAFFIDGREVTFRMDAGTADSAGSTALRVSFQSEDVSSELDLDGRMLTADGPARFEGQMTYRQPLADKASDDGEAESVFAVLQGERASDGGQIEGLRGSVSGATGERKTPPMRASGSIEITADRAVSEALRVEVGADGQPYVLAGRGELFVRNGAPGFTVALEGESFDVDELARRQQAFAASKEPAYHNLSERLEGVRDILREIPKPHIDGVIQLSLPVVTIGDTTLRSLSFRAMPASNGWLLDGLSVELPGRTRVEADGVLRLDPALGFRGDLLVASRQPSGLSDWLTGDVDPVIRDLERAGFSASVDLGPARQTFRDLEIDLDGSTLTGMIERVSNDAGGRLTARLTGGETDLEALRALGAMATGSQTPMTSVSRYDIALDAGPVEYGAFEADRVDADFLYDGTVLAIAKLDVDGLAGASFSGTGQFSGLGADAEGKIELDLNSDDPAQFLAFLDRVLPETPLIEVLRSRGSALGPLALSGEIESIERGTGSPTLLIRLDGTAAETNIDFSAAIENGFRALQLSGRIGLDLRLETDRPAALLTQLGLPARETAIEGPLELETSISASARGPAVVSATLRTPQTEGDLESVLDLTDHGVENVDASVRLSSQSLGPWLDAFDIDAALSEETRADLDADLVASIGYSGDRWQVSELSGSLAGQALEGDLEISDGDGITGRLSADRLSLPWLARLVYGVDPLGAGDQIWSTAPFTSSLLPDVPVSISLRTGRADIGDLQIDEFSAALSSSARELSLTGISGRVLGGDIAGDLMVRNLDGLGSFSADLRGDELRVSMIAPGLAGDGDNSDLTVTAKLDGTAQSAEGLISAMAGAGEVTAVGLVIPGVPSAPMDALLAAADGENFSADEDTPGAFDTISKDEAFQIPRLVSGYSVNAGTVILPPVTVSETGSDLTMSGRLDLSDFDVDADLRLEIDPGDAAVEGAQPEVRYTLKGPFTAPLLERNDTVLANYLAVRALEREQARVEAMQERLEETLRLRRETRFYRWLDRRREEKSAPALEPQGEAASQDAAVPAPEARAEQAPPPKVVPAASDADPPKNTSEPKLDFENAGDGSGPAAPDSFERPPGVRDPLSLGF